LDVRLLEFEALAMLDLSGIGLRCLSSRLHLPICDEDDEDECTASEQPASPLRRCRKLRDVLLANNALGPTLTPATSLHGFALLRSLDLEGNGLTALPTGPVATLLALESFNVSHNMLTSLPASLGLMPELRVLRASFNLIEDMPAKLGPVTLTELFLRSNRLSGDGTAALA
jgi:Leucine-rich repeat (LRR) protein